MNTSTLELPQHLYIETADPDGNVTGVTYSADKLIAWSEDGYGDAVDRWCQQICDRNIAAIDAWEQNRFLELEEAWMSIEHDEEDEHWDKEEAHYHRACDAASREADLKRERARGRMAEHEAAIEKLVQQSREFVASREPPPQEDHLAGYLVAIAAVAAAAYALIDW